MGRWLAGGYAPEPDGAAGAGDGEQAAVGANGHVGGEVGRDGEFGEEFAGLPVAESQKRGAVDGILKHENDLEAVGSGESEDESGKAVDDDPLACGEIEEGERTEGIGRREGDGNAS